MTFRWPDIDGIDVVRLVDGCEPLDLPAPGGGGPHVVEQVRLPLATWQRVEAEASARGVQPAELLAQLVEAAMSPELQRAITQLVPRAAPPAA